MRDPLRLRALARIAVVLPGGWLGARSGWLGARSGWLGAGLGRRPLLALAAGLALGVTGCAVRAAPLPPDHPASPRAAVGRLAPPPASLRPAAAPPPPTKPAEPPPPHHHH